jgi:very-short-patch-repair endonuclease
VIDLNGRRLAGVYACGPDAVLSHRSAARLWGVAPRRVEAIEVTCPPGRHPERPRIVTHQILLAPDEMDEIDGIPVTSVFRTVFDVAAVGTEREVERALHEAEVQQLTDRVSLPILLDRHPGHPGNGTVRNVLGAKRPVGISRNDFEERFLALLDANGLPRPRMNASLHVRDSFIEADCLWQRQRLIVELDSRSVHGTESHFHGDRRRDRRLLAEGWRSTRVTWHQLRDEPDEIVADLRDLLGAAD